MRATEPTEQLSLVSFGAGIGGGVGGGAGCTLEGGGVTINGGHITAYGSYHGAGIGGGYRNGCTLFVSKPMDGAIKARWGKCESCSAGTAPHAPVPGDITVNGGYIEATSGVHGLSLIHISSATTRPRPIPCAASCAQAARAQRRWRPSAPPMRPSARPLAPR